MRDFSVELPQGREPWLVPLATRLAEFLAVGSDRRRVVYVYDAPNTSSFRYRVYNVKQWLDGSRICVSYFYRYELDVVTEHLLKADLIILARSQWTLSYQRLIDLAKMRHLPVWFDTDDLICCLDSLQLITNTLNVALDNEEAYSFWCAMIGRGEMVARQADGFLVTNAYLGECLSRRFGGKPFRVIENSLNREQLEISAAVSGRKQSYPGDDEFLIGYFSGTPSHINDFRIVAPELMQVLEDFPQAKLVVVGFMEFPPEMNRLIKEGRIVFRPLVDFMELQVKMAEVDISIVPLVENEFTNCKSELKFFEGAVVDTVTLASPIHTYAHSIRHGETGFLCRPGEWYRTIADIIGGKYDLKRMVAQAKRECLERYAGEGFVKSAVSVLGSDVSRV